MEQIGFIGVYDKKDLLLNVANLMSKLNKRVLIVDATIMQRLRYIIPKISATPTYISEYNSVDVAVGFMNLGGIANYLGTNTINYDYVLIDTDNPQTLNSFMLQNSKKNFFVTSYDEFEIQRSLEIFAGLRGQIKLSKIIVSSDINNKHDEYLKKIFSIYPIEWGEEKIEFADTDNDRKSTLINQLLKQIEFKNYTSGYKDMLEYLTSLILEGIIEQANIRKMIRKR